jgi:DNA modification methylase
MEVTDVPRLVYDAQHKRLYHGDVRFDASTEPIAVLLTDPPYASNQYLKATEDAGKLDPAADQRWSGDVFNWVGQWWWPLRARLSDDGVAWIFCSVHYFGFYLRWAHYSQLSVRGIFPCPPAEYLIALGPQQIDNVDARAIRDACQGNTYGQNKPLALLRTLLRVSPPGLVVDPFCGLGSTLDAAFLEGRDSVGVEIRQALVTQTINRWRVLDHT